MIWSWHTGRWWVGCYIWYSGERTGRGPSHRCTKCNSPPINGQCINHRIAIQWSVALQFQCAHKGLSNRPANISIKVHVIPTNQLETTQRAQTSANAEISRWIVFHRENDPETCSKVIEDSAVGQNATDFLLVFYSNIGRVSYISYRFCATVDFMSKWPCWVTVTSKWHWRSIQITSKMKSPWDWATSYLW